MMQVPTTRCRSRTVKKCRPNYATYVGLRARRSHSAQIRVRPTPRRPPGQCGRTVGVAAKLRRTVGHFCLGRLLEPLVEASTDLLGSQLRPLPLLADDDDTRSGDTGEAGETDSFPEVHDQETLQ